MANLQVLETPCYPCKFTITKDGKTPLDNGDFSLWVKTREEAESKIKELNARG